jgi:hypothetical protein
MVTECPENKFRCPKGGPDGKPLCINRSQLCDEKQDCEDGADEEAACCKCAHIFCKRSILSLKRQRASVVRLSVLSSYFQKGETCLFHSDEYVRHTWMSIQVSSVSHWRSLLLSRGKDTRQ